MEQLPEPRTVTVSQRHRRSIQAVIGVVVMVLGLAGSLVAQPTVSGKITAVVFFGLLIALIVWLWRWINRGRDRLEITPDAISLRHGRGGGPSITLTREQGTDLRLIPALRDHGVSVGPRLTVVGSGQDITIYGFSADAVRQGCTAAGWRFGNGTPEEAARDLRDLREDGRQAEAAQLIELFGAATGPSTPIPAARSAPQTNRRRPQAAAPAAGSCRSN